MNPLQVNIRDLGHKACTLTTTPSTQSATSLSFLAFGNAIQNIFHFFVLQSKMAGDEICIYLFFCIYFTLVFRLTISPKNLRNIYIIFYQETEIAQSKLRNVLTKPETFWCLRLSNTVRNDPAYILPCVWFCLPFWLTITKDNKLRTQSEIYDRSIDDYEWKRLEFYDYIWAC